MRTSLYPGRKEFDSIDVDETTFAGAARDTTSTRNRWPLTLSDTGSDTGLTRGEQECSASKTERREPLAVVEVNLDIRSEVARFDQMRCYETYLLLKPPLRSGLCLLVA